MACFRNYNQIRAVFLAQLDGADDAGDVLFVVAVDCIDLADGYFQIVFGSCLSLV